MAKKVLRNVLKVPDIQCLVVRTGGPNVSPKNSDTLSMKMSPYILAVASTLLIACSNAGPSGWWGSATTNAKSDGNTKPTDQGEGLPGYLTDPNLIAVSEEEEGCYSFSGAPGTIAAVDGRSPSRITVRLFELAKGSRWILNKALPAKPIDLAPANADGSFTLAGRYCPGEAVVAISAGVPSSENMLVINSYAEGVYDAAFFDLAEGIFSAESFEQLKPGFDSQCQKDGLDQPELAPASTEVIIQSPFAADYAAYDLGMVPSIAPQKYGGLIIKRGSKDKLLIAAWDDQAVYEVSLYRNHTGQITGFRNDTKKIADTECGIDGGLTFVSDTTLYAVGFPCAKLFAINIVTGEVVAKDVNNFFADTNTTGGAINILPEWHSRAGAMKFASWPGGDWLEVSNVDGPPAAASFSLPGGVEGFAWLPAGSAAFPKPAIIFSEWQANIISTYEADLDGNPVIGTRRVFATDVNGANGAMFDPQSGDFLFSTWSAESRVISIRGFQAHETSNVHDCDPAPP